jgi:hypothetical protein
MSVTVVPKPDGYMTTIDQARQDLVDELVFENDAVCPNCFARVQHVHSSDAKIEAIDETNADRYGARVRYSEVDGCEECGELDSRGGRSLSLEAAIGRVPMLVTRIQEAGHEVDVDAVFDHVRAAKTDPEMSGKDKDIARDAAIAGLRAAGTDPRPLE